MSQMLSAYAPRIKYIYIEYVNKSSLATAKTTTTATALMMAVAILSAFRDKKK